ncbi:hypothetical protein ONZ45_g4598 [Pleurotus djamor]|nr:hypothetical protein ONZ45_g4598 [Pleurotus djamor]
MSSRLASLPPLSPERAYYRFSKFQLSPDPSELSPPCFDSVETTFAMAIPKPRVYPSSTESRSSSSSNSSALMSTSGYRLQRTKGQRYKKPTKRYDTPKPATPVLRIPWDNWDSFRSLGHWVGQMIFNSLSFGINQDCNVDWTAVIRDAGQLIYVEMLRLELPAEVIVASVFYTSRTLPLVSLDWESPYAADDLKCIIHMLFLVYSRIACRNFSDNKVPLSTWTQNLRDIDVSGFEQQEYDALVALEYKINIPRGQWRAWILETARTKVTCYTLPGARPQQLVQHLLDQLAGTSMVD